MPVTDRGRQAPLAIDGGRFRAIGHALVDQIAAFLESLPERPVTPNESRSVVRDALRLSDSLPEQGTDPASLLTETAQGLFDHSLFNARRSRGDSR